MARRLHHDHAVMGSVRRVTWLVALALGAPGCFYADAINERPSAEIERVGSGVPRRGDNLSFRAVVHDPDRDDDVRTLWRFEACNAVDVCAADETGSDPTFNVTVPPMVDAQPTVRVVVTLDIADSYGAAGRPTQRVVLDVVNNAPIPSVQRRGREINGSFPPDVPIVVSASAIDADGDPVTLAWELFPARDSVPGDRTFAVLPDPPSGGEERLLIPDVDGEWMVRVTASDGLAESIFDLPILVVPDQPPCLGALDPAPPPPGAALLLDQPRRISVLVVEDDLDIFPAPPPDDPYLLPASFRWYLRPPGASGFTLVDTDVSGLELDPAQFAPGDLIDVRVEIDDRVGRTIPCAEGAATCSIGQDACLQRQTWTVEVR
jgi:hypothetical protein